MKHEWKKGDRVLVEATVSLEADSDGDVHFKVDVAGGEGYEAYALAERMRPLAPAPPDHSAYIGKTLADVPDGTVAVVEYSESLKMIVRRFAGPSIVQEPLDGGVWRSVGRSARHYKILHIVKLGEPKPVTLAEAVKAFLELPGKPTSDVADAIAAMRDALDREERGDEDGRQGSSRQDES